jgi:hypothetical protein
MEIIINETGRLAVLTIVDDNGNNYFDDLIAGDDYIKWDSDAEAYRADADTVQWWRDRIDDIYAVEERAREVADELNTTKRHIMTYIEEAHPQLDEHYREAVLELLNDLTADDLD